MLGQQTSATKESGRGSTTLFSHPLDTSLARRSNLVRKGLAYALQVPRACHQLVSAEKSYQANPPVIVNSIPKSGTHLLMQIARALPDTGYYGSFLAQTPSVSLQKRSQGAIDFHIGRIAPGEVVGAHLHYSRKTAEKLAAINALHLVIIRDPLEVLASEAYYLAHMNPFHRMAREFQGLNQAERLKRALDGSRQRPDLFPCFEKRIEPYVGWMTDNNAVVVRYEAFKTPETRAQTVESIADAWFACKGAAARHDRVEVVRRASTAIAPEKSHTKSERDQKSSHAVAFVERLADLRTKLGYG